MGYEGGPFSGAVIASKRFLATTGEKKGERGDNRINDLSRLRAEKGGFGGGLRLNYADIVMRLVFIREYDSYLRNRIRTSEHYRIRNETLV